jgi:hypothetical protein
MKTIKLLLKLVMLWMMWLISTSYLTEFFINRPINAGIQILAVLVILVYTTLLVKLTHDLMLKNKRIKNNF